MTPQLDRRRAEAALKVASERLLALRSAGGQWAGELSSSALSTATAVCALSLARNAGARQISEAVLERGLAWLVAHANADGGWGDTILSLSNISTTTLCWAVFGSVSGADARHRSSIAAAESWIGKHVAATGLNRPASSSGGIDPATLVPAIVRRYGKDRTFSVPILTMCALAGRLGTGRDAWRWVKQLPFELAACPHQWFATLRLPVVSYALPALIAIGQARHRHLPTRNPLTRIIRRLTTEQTLRVLSEIQPTNGGFLEATPLTSFVTMSLAGSGLADHGVCRKGVEFLLASQRTDGSWPIDTNLSTWVSTLAVNALGQGTLKTGDCERLRQWLLDQQYQHEHSYTHAAPGGWAWTNLPGGVPDADDTAGALLALAKLGNRNGQVVKAAAAGVRWLLDLQNRDGGIPTFCRGWGALPFDRSSADITAHALQAWLTWQNDLPALRTRISNACRRAVDFLARVQRRDGAWIPLWFGNQLDPNDENPTYGTSRVLVALAAARAITPLAALERGLRRLVESQSADGSWFGSIEETALAVEALAKAPALPGDLESRVELARCRASDWLMQRVEAGTWESPAPIGFYFAKLWYFEKLYPIIFTVGALQSIVDRSGANAN